MCVRVFDDRTEHIVCVCLRVNRERDMVKSLSALVEAHILYSSVIECGGVVANGGGGGRGGGRYRDCSYCVCSRVYV